MEQGAVFYHNNFTFHNGISGGKKLLVVLSDSKPEESLLCFLTTSQKISSPKLIVGCYSYNNYYITFCNPFKKKTKILFDKISIYEFNQIELLNAKYKEDIRIIGKINETDLCYILKCISESKDVEIGFLERLSYVV